MNWYNLRPWNGSQQSAFEELVCQLARHETTPEGSIFVKKGAPDAGVECFWKLPNNKELAWQAKFFTSTPTAQQWQQIDSSVKKAIEKHPDLANYTVCLAADRADARLPEQSSFLNKWKTHVKKWVGWAKEKKMRVNFDYWGSYEITEKLSLEAHRGRIFFWFNQENFSSNWFETRLKEAMASIGPRYTPELNVKLEISTIFRGLARSANFVSNLQKLYGEVGQTWEKCYLKDIECFAKKEIAQLNTVIENIISIGRQIAKPGIDFIDWKALKEAIGCGFNKISDIQKKVDNERQARIDQQKVNKQKALENTDFQVPHNHAGHYLRMLEDSLASFISFIKTNEAHLANSPALLLLGDAGKGKTHLLADFANHHVKAGFGAVFLTGYDFVITDDPWHQILRKLSLNCNKEELLGAMNAFAEATGQRTVIIIDALNEGEAKNLWKRALPAMLVLLKNYKWLGLAISVRTTYEKNIIPKDLENENFVRVFHKGFEGCEFLAIKSFFAYYDIKLPSTPILNPEFHTPLFLNCFCKGLKNRNLTEVPKGLKGITSIFNFFLDSVNEKLAESEFLDFDKKSNLISKVVAKFATEMNIHGSRSISREIAKKICNEILPKAGFENSLFSHLLSENILIETISYDENEVATDMIEFSYDRFADHILAKQIIDYNLTLSKDTKWLTNLFKKHYDFYDQRGLLEAFSIQIPEKYNRELFEIFNEQQHPYFVEIFIDSLLWRKHSSINLEKSLRFLNKFLKNDRNLRYHFFDTLFIIAPEPNHPFNGNFVHNFLIKLDMPDRDFIWSKNIYEAQKYFNSIDQLIDWASTAKNTQNIADDSLLLTGKILAWLLSNSNRFIRDKATKALVKIFTKKLSCLCVLLVEFNCCDDLYVLERLYAVAYGCSMRSSDRKGKEKLAKVVYQQIFASGQPPCHILLRDYARGVIEVAIAQELNLEGIQVKKIRPPYKSEWPIKIPSEKEIDQLQPSETKNRAEKIAISTIFMSVVGSGDFARYVLGSDYISMDWLQREIQQKKPDRPKDIYEKFINNLSPRQNKVFNDYILAANKLTHAEWLTRLSFTDTGKSIKKLKAYLKKAEQDFLKAVRTKKTETFKQIIKPFLLKGKENFEEPHFPVCKAQRWILKRVFELGWSSKLFAQFDWNVERYDSSHRDAGKPERIGKKYQWIAYHEFLAHLADNLVFAGDEEEPYKGPWQISVRNIDPSFTLSETFSDHWANNRVSWWSPQTYDSWYEKRNTVSWLKDCEFLKQLPISPIVQDPKTGIKWFNLECNYSFMETLPPECPPNSRERRYLRIWLKSYLIRKPDIKNFKKWATEQNFFGDWMPSSHDQSEVFFGEFYWSEAFNSFNNSYNHRNSWTSDNNKLPFEVLVTTDNYFSETNCYDCSVDKTINVFLPAQEIFEKMNLSWNGSEGKYFSQEGDLVAFDPSTHENGPQSLLIEEKVFSEFLEKENCALVWTITGEKGVLVGKTPQKKFEGKMEISCFLALQNGKVTGEISPYWVTIGPNKKRMDTFKIEIDKNLACKTKAKKKL